MKNQYVCHAGVKGMKWGHRKQSSSWTGQRKKMSKRTKTALKISGGIALGVAFGVVGRKAISVVGKSNMRTNASKLVNNVLDENGKRLVSDFIKMKNMM